MDCVIVVENPRKVVVSQGVPTLGHRWCIDGRECDEHGQEDHDHDDVHLLLPVALECGDSHCFQPSKEARLVQQRKVVDELLGLDFRAFIDQKLILFDLLLSNRNEHLLEGHVLDSVLADAKFTWICVDLLKDLTKVGRHVVCQLVHIFAGFIDGLGDRMKASVLILLFKGA